MWVTSKKKTFQRKGVLKWIEVLETFRRTLQGDGQDLESRAKKLQELEGRIRGG